MLDVNVPESPALPAHHYHLANDVQGHWDRLYQVYCRIGFVAEKQEVANFVMTLRKEMGAAHARSDNVQKALDSP